MLTDLPPPSDHSALLARFADVIGERHVMTDALDMQPFLKEERDLWHGLSPCVLRPGSTEEVAAIMKICHETNTPVVPQGGNTGLVGGQTHRGHGAESSARFRKPHHQLIR